MQTLTSSHPCFHRDRKPTVVNSLSSSDSTVMSWKVHLPQTSDWVSVDSSTDTPWRTSLVSTDATTVTSWQLSGSHKRQDRTRDDRQSRHIINTNTNGFSIPTCPVNQTLSLVQHYHSKSSSSRLTIKLSLNEHLSHKHLD
ncbi:hypothetical protein YC2023_015762 [Brassica napus]